MKLDGKELPQAFLEQVEILSQKEAHYPGLYQLGEGFLSPQWDFFARSLTRELMKARVLQAILWKDRVYYEYGFRLLSTIKIDSKLKKNYKKILNEYLDKKLILSGKFKKNQESFITYTSVHSRKNADFVLILVKSEADSNIPLDIWLRIVQLLESFGYAVGGREERFVGLFQDFTKHFLNEIKRILSTGVEYGVVTHFYIQDLDKYFHSLGQQKSYEILKTIQTLFASKVKSEDIFVHQDKRSYYLFSPLCKKEVVLKRFEQFFLQIQNLIIDYRMRFWEVTRDTDLEKEWMEFLESN